MKLKLPAILGLAVLLAGGCTIHFPLGDNVPSLSSEEDTTSSNEANHKSTASTAPNTIDTTKGNTADTVDVPR